MSQLTITEALAEIKTLTDRIAKKRQHTAQYIMRDSRVRDPHEKNGGSPLYIASEWQAIADLESRLITIRALIQVSNHATSLTVGSSTRTVADWLTWRREIVAHRMSYLENIQNSLMRARKEWKGAQPQNVPQGMEDAQLLVNIDEPGLLAEIESTQQILNELDGKLSLINATTSITI